MEVVGRKITVAFLLPCISDFHHVLAMPKVKLTLWVTCELAPKENNTIRNNKADLNIAVKRKIVCKSMKHAVKYAFIICSLFYFSPHNSVLL